MRSKWVAERQNTSWAEIQGAGPGLATRADECRGQRGPSILQDSSQYWEPVFQEANFPFWEGHSRNAAQDSVGRAPVEAVSAKVGAQAGGQGGPVPQGRNDRRLLYLEHSECRERGR